MTQAIAIFGAGGFGREVLDVIEACNRERPGTYDVRGFLSELDADQGRRIRALPVLGGHGWIAANPSTAIVCGIGAPHVRRQVIEQCERTGCEFATVVHPRATLTEHVRIGAGCVITAGVVATNEITIGNHVHLNLNVTVGHDATIADFVTVAPGVNVSGNVTIATGCDIGTGTAIIQGVRIDEWSIVGAGAVVTGDLPANVTAVGAPAKPIKERATDWWRA